MKCTNAPRAYFSGDCMEFHLRHDFGEMVRCGLAKSDDDETRLADVLKVTCNRRTMDRDLGETYPFVFLQDYGYEIRAEGYRFGTTGFSEWRSAAMSAMRETLPPVELRGSFRVNDYSDFEPSIGLQLHSCQIHQLPIPPSSEPVVEFFRWLRAQEHQDLAFSGQVQLDMARHTANPDFWFARVQFTGYPIGGCIGAFVSKEPTHAQ